MMCRKFKTLSTKQNTLALVLKVFGPDNPSFWLRPWSEPNKSACHSLPPFFLQQNCLTLSLGHFSDFSPTTLTPHNLKVGLQGPSPRAPRNQPPKAPRVPLKAPRDPPKAPRDPPNAPGTLQRPPGTLVLQLIFDN